MNKSYTIEPQNHRKDKVIRDHSGSCGPASLFYRVILDMAEIGVWLVLEYLWQRRLHDFSGRYWLDL